MTLFFFVQATSMWELFDQEPIAQVKDGCPTFCLDCEGELRFHEEEGEIVCTNCGVVQSNIIDKQQDQSTALSEGSSINHQLPKSSLGTSISGRRWMKLKQVNDWWKWVYKEKSFYDDKKYIEERCRKANLSQAVLDNSVILYKKASETRHKDTDKYVIIRGMNRKAIMAAAVYYGARFQHQPCTPKQIADIFDLEHTQMTRGCKKFQVMVDLSEHIRFAEKNETYDYIKTFCFKKNIGKEEKEKALEVVRNMERLQLGTNHQPPAVAAVALLLTAQTLAKRASKQEYASFFKVSENTVTKTYKEVYPFFRIVTNEDLTNEYLKDMTGDIAIDV